MYLPLHVIEKQTLAAPAATVTFTLGTQVTDWDSQVGVTSRHLVVLSYAASDQVARQGINFILNADGGGNYARQHMSGIAGASSAAGNAGLTSIPGGTIPGTGLANAAGGGFILIPHAFNTTDQKATLVHGGAGEENVTVNVGRWANTAAITSITLIPAAGNFVANSIFLLCVVDERSLIAEVDLAGGNGPVVFDNIPQLDGDLVYVGFARGTRAANSDTATHEINDDGVAANYTNQRLYAAGAALTAARGAASQLAGRIPGDTAGANEFGALYGQWIDYAGTDHKHGVTIGGYHQSAPGSELSVISNRWMNVDPIGKLEFLNLGGANFVQGSLISLYRMPHRRIQQRVLAADSAEMLFRLHDFTDDFDILMVNICGRSDRAAINDLVTMTFNDDLVGANYDRQQLYGAAAVVTAAQSAANRNWLQMVGATEGANECGGSAMSMPFYANTIFHKHGLIMGGRGEMVVALKSTRWEDTAAIIRLAMAPWAGTAFIAGSIGEMEGVVPLNTTIRRKSDMHRYQQFLQPIGKAWRP